MAILFFAVAFTAIADTESICIGGVCFPVASDESIPSVTNSAPAMVAKYDVVASADGYMGRDQFLRFLRSALEPGSKREFTFSTFPLAFLAEHGWLATLLVIFIAGMALNLTPCVLPMIPVQLAILGIGGISANGSKRPLSESLGRGTVYGLSMALSYGILGAIIVRSGGFFGALQSSPWFNLAIAVLFILLALALFDAFFIDFSRFGRFKGKSAGLAAVFATGAIDAILAGSCVAPALLAVLVLSGTLYAEGHTAAIALPFVLGIGMGFPWPFIAAGIASIPKPGPWMNRVKWIFGVIVILLAVYFANLAFVGFNKHAPKSHFKFNESVDASVLHEKLATVDMSSKPVLLDFWASWCRNCSAMERVTFKDADIARTLSDDFTLIRVEAEDPRDPATASVLKEFDVIGIPAFRVIKSHK